MKVNTTIIVCCSISVTLLGCNEDFVSGVTKGGSGNGRPTLPDHNHDRPSLPDHKDGRGDPKKDRFQEQEHYELTLNPSITDQCGLISRKISFLDRLDQDIKRTAVYIFNQNEIADHRLHIRMEYENHATQMASLKYLDCDVPLSLLRSDHSEQLFPKQHCTTFKSLDILPNQKVSFDLRYDLNAPIHGVLMPNESTEIQINGISQSCNSLALAFDFIKHDQIRH